MTDLNKQFNQERNQRENEKLSPNSQNTYYNLLQQDHKIKIVVIEHNEQTN